MQGSDVTNIQTDLAELAGIIAASSEEIEELNPWCFLTLGMIVLALALAAHLQSLTFQTLGVILLSHMRWRARLAVGKARAQAALGHAALRTFGDGSSSTGNRLRTFGDGSYARVIIGSTGHRPRSASKPQAPQPYHRP